MALKEDSKPKAKLTKQGWMKPEEFIAKKLKEANETLARVPPRDISSEEYYAWKAKLDKEQTEQQASKRKEEGKKAA
jgi:hypothetical protein